MATLYSDGTVKCDEDGILIRHYYFPFVSKRIAYDRIRRVEHREMGLGSGRLRLWGTSYPGIWYSFDLRRPAKRIAIIVDKGDAVKAAFTPEDSDAVLRILQEHVPSGATAAP